MELSRENNLYLSARAIADELNYFINIDVYGDLNEKEAARLTGRNNCIYYVEIFTRTGDILTRAYVTDDNIPIFIYTKVYRVNEDNKVNAMNLLIEACKEVNRLQ